MAVIVERDFDQAGIVDLAGGNPHDPREPFKGLEEITERVVKSFLDLFVLEMLGGSPKHGYEIMKRLESETGTRVGPGTLYPLLYELENRRLILGEWVSARKTRKVYRLTQTGEIFVKDSFRSVGQLLERIHSPFAWVKLH